MLQSVRNIAILAHVDAGKTTLSERILFTAGEIRRPGNVEEGLATMDYLPEEKDRGITIESGVAHFEWRGMWFNFIDTPGHVDFGAEVDMALSAVEGAVLVISAASGVETQTIAAWKKLRSRGVRTLIFINKLDNPDYSLDDILINVEEMLGVRPVLLSVPEYDSGKMTSVLDVISNTRLIHAADGREEAKKITSKASAAIAAKYYKEAVEFASRFDDVVLEKAMAEQPIPPEDLIRSLESLAASDDCILCYSGSALENYGVRGLMTGLSFFLSPPPTFKEGLLGQVIRLRHFQAFGEISLFRSMASLDRTEWPKEFEFFRMKANMLLPVDELRSGDIYAMRSKKEMELGAQLDLGGNVVNKEDSENARVLYQPLLQTQVECLKIEDYAHVEQSLGILSRMDPSFRVVRHAEGGFWVLYTVGEVQLDVLIARLKREFGCEVQVGNPDVKWQERLRHQVGPLQNSFQAGPLKVTLSLSAAPLPITEHDVQLKADFLENAPREILAGLRSALLEAADVGFLGKGALVGVQFELHSLDCVGDVPIPMIKKACADAVIMLIKPMDLVLYEPYMELSVECPVSFAGVVTGEVQSREGKVREINGDGKIHFLRAEVPLRNFFGFSTAVRSISKGTAQYSLRFLDYRHHNM